MDKRVHTPPLNGNVLESFHQITASYRTRWEALCSKYSKSTYETPLDMGEFAVKEYKILADTPDVATLADKIETSVQSTLYNILLKREKMKILHKKKAFAMSDAATRKEISRVLKFVAKPDVKKYTILCFTLKDHVRTTIEEAAGYEFGKALIKQKKWEGHPEKFEKYNKMTREIWRALMELMPDEDITVYAVDVLRQYYTWVYMQSERNTVDALSK